MTFPLNPSAPARLRKASANLMCLLALAGAASAPMTTLAQSFPSRTVKIVVGYGAGGDTDVLARYYALKLQDVLGTSVIVENKPGASELLAALPVMQAAPDGHTLWLGTGGALAQNPGLRKDLQYDVSKNFTPIALIAEAEAVVVVRPTVPVSTLPELIAYGRAHPGKLNYGSGGIGSGNHLWMEYVSSATQASFTHIPYKSAVEITRDLVGGNVDFAMITAQTAIPLIKDGKVNAVAVTGNRRIDSLPSVPSFAEAGVPELASVDAYTFFAIMGPAGLPAPIVEKLNQAINQVTSNPEVEARVRDRMQLRPRVATPNEFRDMLAKQLGKWRGLGDSIQIGTK